MRRTFVLAACALVAGMLAVAPAAAPTFPSRIDLPDGFQPEGIAIAGETFFVGSIPTGAIYRGSLRTGDGAVLVAGASGRAAIGVDVDRGRVFVAGGPTGKAFVYDAATGRAIATYRLTTRTTFVNDVVVTRTAAWFTDSVNPVLYRVSLGRNGRPVGKAKTVPLKGDIRYASGFNVNGIDAAPSGNTLVLVQSNTGKLFTATPAGVTRELDLGGTTLPNGDGILLDGSRLYVVQNRLNQIAVVALSSKLRSGRVTRTITSSEFDVPTTIAEYESWLYAVNARFGTADPANADYWITRVAK